MRFGCLTSLVLGLALAEPILAQEFVDVRTTTPIAELLNQFVDQQMGSGGDAYQTLSKIILGSVARSPRDVAALKDGLADLAIKGPTGPIRVRAVGILSVAGWASHPAPDRTIPQRLLRLFEQTQDPVIRGVILSKFQLLANHNVGLGLFRRVLTQDAPPFASSADDQVAVAGAVEMGEAGRALLRELLDAGTIRRPGTAAKVRRLRDEGRLGGGR